MLCSRDEAMNSARLFETPRHSSNRGGHRWKNLRRRIRTARRVEGGFFVGRVCRFFTWLVPHGTVRLWDNSHRHQRRTEVRHEAHPYPGI